MLLISKPFLDTFARNAGPGIRNGLDFIQRVSVAGQEDDRTERRLGQLVPLVE